MKNYDETMSTEETKEIQKRLVSAGLIKPEGVDGIFGELTKAALEIYMQSLEEKPLPSKPWWESRRGRGMAKLVAGTLVTIIGMFWAGASGVDAGQAVDLVYEAGPLVQQLIEIAGALLAAFGFGQSYWGAIKAERPLDSTLVAKVKGKEVRLPSKQKDNNKMSEVDEWLGRR